MVKLLAIEAAGILFKFKDDANVPASFLATPENLEGHARE